MSDIQHPDLAGEVSTGLDFFYQDKFKFVLRKTKLVSYLCFDVKFPSVTINRIDVQTGINPYPVAGNKLLYDNLTLSFKIDENLENWLEIYNWMRGLGTPSSSDEFVELLNTNDVRRKGNVVTYDGTLFTLTNKMSSNVKFFFNDMFPINLTGPELTLSNVPQGIVLTASVTFAFTRFLVSI